VTTDDGAERIDELTLVRARVGVVEAAILRAAKAVAWPEEATGEVVARAIRACDPGAVGRVAGGPWAEAAAAYERGRDLAQAGRVAPANEALDAAVEALARTVAAPAHN